MAENQQPHGVERTTEEKPLSEVPEKVTETMPLMGLELLSGSRIHDRYRVVKELGRGGMGVVYLACDEELSSRRVVLKILQDKPHRMEWLRKKFDQERAALAALNHPGIVGVFDAGALPDGRPFIVMQYAGGASLRREVDARPMALTRVAEILRQLGSALAIAHTHGICHRDIKPENIMVEQLGSDETIVRIIDFGLAALRNPDELASQTAVAAGSFPYIAPEQMLGRAGPAADIYALAITAWEMLTGSPPQGLAPVTSNYIEKAIRDLRPEVPASAEVLLLKALSLDPNDRPQNAKEFAAQVAQALCCPVSAVPETEPIVLERSDALPPQPEASANRRRLAAAALFVLFTLAGAGLFLVRASRPRVVLEFTYSLSVRGSDGARRPLAKEAVLPPGYGIKLIVRSPADGFLYVVNEGPAIQAGQLWTWLFPQPGFQNGSGAIHRSQPITIPPAEEQYLVLDKRLGTEKVYVLWSMQPIPELEPIKASVFSSGSGGGLSASEAQTVHAIIARNDRPIQTNTVGDGTTVSGAGPVVVKLIPLEHM
jgi:tRNA A-37 threonylcarbamoyl transferase component Bud32